MFEYLKRNYALTNKGRTNQVYPAQPSSTQVSKISGQHPLSIFPIILSIRIHGDHGREFTNTLFGDLCQLFEIKMPLSSIAHTQSIESIERFHDILVEMIRFNQADHRD